MKAVRRLPAKANEPPDDDWADDYGTRSAQCLASAEDGGAAGEGVIDDEDSFASHVSDCPVPFGAELARSPRPGCRKSFDVVLAESGDQLDEFVHGYTSLRGNCCYGIKVSDTRGVGAFEGREERCRGEPVTLPHRFRSPTLVATKGLVERALDGHQRDRQNVGQDTEACRGVGALTASGLTVGTAMANLAYPDLGCSHRQQRWDQPRNVWPWIRDRRDYTRENDSVSRSKATSSMISRTCSTTWTPGSPTRASAHGWLATTCFNNSRRRPCRRASSA